MGFVLQILGLIFLALIIFVIVVVLTIRARVRTFVKNLEGLASRLPQTPAHIRLLPMVSNDWHDIEVIGDLVAPLKELGFENAGEYEVEEIDRLRLQALVKPDECVTAVVSEHPVEGVWLDLSTDFTDGTRITFANTHHGGRDEPIPGHLFERFPGLGAKALYQKFLNDRPLKPMQPASAADFAALYEKAYADQMDWRHGRGAGPAGDDPGPAALEVDPDSRP